MRISNTIILKINSELMILLYKFIVPPYLFLQTFCWIIEERYTYTCRRIWTHLDATKWLSFTIKKKKKKERINTLPQNKLYLPYIKLLGMAEILQFPSSQNLTWTPLLLLILNKDQLEKLQIPKYQVKVKRPLNESEQTPLL